MGKARPYAAKQRGRRARYSSFDHQRRESEQRAVRETMAPAPPRRHGDVGTGPPCPQDPAHGHLLSWTGQWDFWCPHELHDGFRFFERAADGSAVRS